MEQKPSLLDKVPLAEYGLATLLLVNIVGDYSRACGRTRPDPVEAAAAEHSDYMRERCKNLLRLTQH